MKKPHPFFKNVDKDPTLFGNLRTEYFYQNHARIHNMPYAEAQMEVLKVMRTLQDALLRDKAFYLPGIGMTGLIGRNTRNLYIRSTNVWWAPGICSLLNDTPNWQASPLLPYLDAELIKLANSIRKRQNLKVLGQDTFKRVPDTNLEYPTSADKIFFINGLSARERFEAYGACAKLKEENEKLKAEIDKLSQAND
jgi:hypothetical protein